MQNYGGIQQNMNDPTHQMNMQMPYGFSQIRSGQEFPVPITATQNVQPAQRKPRNTKKHPAPQPPLQPQQIRMLQQPNQLQQFQPPPPPQQQAAQQIDPMASMGQIPTKNMGQPSLQQLPQMSQQQMSQPQMQQMQQQLNQKMQKQQPGRPIQPNFPKQQQIDPDIFLMHSETLCSFCLMDSVDTDWIDGKQNPEVIDCINNANVDENDLDFSSIQNYINVSNNLFNQK